MDRVIKYTLCLFIVIFIIFASVVSYQAFVENAYRNSLSSTFSYTSAITTDTTLSNVTFFLPVPADLYGNSPIVARFSTRDMGGIPEDWTVTLYDTGKATMVRISTPEITPPAGTTPEKPYSIMLSSNMKSETVIDTREPQKNSALFRPVRDLRQVSCAGESSLIKNTSQCYHFLTSLYADYDAPNNATVTIRSTVGGKNSWKIFEPASNEYNASVRVTLYGDAHGWSTMNGSLTAGTGIYDAPFRLV